MQQLQIRTGKTVEGIICLNILYPGEQTLEIELIEFYKPDEYFDNLYTHINMYVGTLDAAVQKELYDIFYTVSYREYKFLNQSQAYSDTKTMEDKVARVCELLDYDNFKKWMTSYEDHILYPDNIITTYIEDPDMNTTKEKTYVKREYQNLVNLILFIRAVSPLYIDYYKSVKNVTNHYYYKIFLLFIKSSVYSSPEIQKLKTYIEVNQETLAGVGKNENLIITAGLSDDDVLDSLVSEIIFNKLIGIDVFTKKCNIVSYIFQTIKYKGTFSSSDAGAIRGKAVVSDSTKEDISYFEDYRKTSNVPIGTSTEIQHSLDDLHGLVRQLGYKGFDFDQYQHELANNMRPLMEHRPDKIQTYFLGWFLNKAINPRALFYIDDTKLIELILLAKVILINNNHQYIGMLMSSIRSELPYLNVLSRSGLNKGTIKQLITHYKFAFEEGETSVIEQTILKASKEITDNVWVPVGVPDSCLNIVNKEGFLIVPSGINDVICSFVEFVNT